MAEGQHLSSVYHLLCHEHQSAGLDPLLEQQLFGFRLPVFWGYVHFAEEI